MFASSDHSHRLRVVCSKANVLEELHKICQLSEIGIGEPILNETRYLARGLVDFCSAQLSCENASSITDDQKKKISDALAKAELAVNCAINDAVDTLVAYVKRTDKNFQERFGIDYPTAFIKYKKYCDEYTKVFSALSWIDARVAESRRDRDQRYSIYEDIINSQNLAAITHFATLLPQINWFLLQSSKLVEQSPIFEEMVDALSLTKSSRSRFFIELQPKYHFSDGSLRCNSAEALARFEIDGKRISPEIFIPIAEQTGMIGELGQFVLKQSLQLLKDYPSLDHISVNVSAIELLDTGYSLRVEELLHGCFGRREDGANWSRLELEITETTALKGDRSVAQLKRLSEKYDDIPGAGVRLAIDDFGTGDTRFNYLAEMNISTIKIDRSLVRRCVDKIGHYDRMIPAIVGMAHGYGCQVVAEGVERPKHLQTMIDMQVDQFQGFASELGRPCSREEFIANHLHRSAS